MQNDLTYNPTNTAEQLDGQISHSCQQCQKITWLWPSQVKTRKFCSRECKSLFARTRYSQKTCKHCGQLFHDKIAPRYTERRLYCNKACYNAANKSEEISCKVCGKNFKVSPAKIRRGQERGHVRVHCSEACRRRGNSLRMFGEEPLNGSPNGQCWLCGTEVSHKRLLCRSCHQIRKARVEKAKAIEAYGGKCACCGESNLAYLTIDHVNNDGAAHRRELKKEHGYDPRGVRFYAILRKQGYPQDVELQVLCWNCNCAKQFYGGCPHQGRNLEWLWRESLQSKS